MRVIVVDDSRSNIQFFKRLLRTYDASSFDSFTDGRKAYAFALANSVDLAIVDYRMPGMDGIEFVRLFREARGPEPHVMMVTMAEDLEVRYRAFDAGANEVLFRPLDLREFKIRIANVRKLVRAQEALRSEKRMLAETVAEQRAQIERGAEELVGRLLRAAERRDDDTGNHIVRVAETVRLIAQRLGLEDADVRMLHAAAPMHDIGKIGVPDAVLLKPGRLDEDERRLMEGHVALGYEILRDSAIPLVQVAAEIARTHHERWDGSGYPAGLRGEEIPLAGRIAAVADVFDALASPRPYKEAWSFARAVGYLRENSGSQFDPACVNAFVAAWSEIAPLYGAEPLAAAA